MTRYAAIRRGILGAVIVPLILLHAGAAERHTGTMKLWTPDAMEWTDGPPSLPAGAKVAILEGDPNQEGFFVMRVRIPDGYRVPPHTHPKTERVTILGGTLHLAMGDRLDRASAKPMPAGSYGYWPAGMKHAAWAEGETTLQIHGTGPWEINYLNPADDPRNRASR
jgi:quercetin dioxygenase-like cupin family protein